VEFVKESPPNVTIAMHCNLRADRRSACRSPLYEANIMPWGRTVKFEHNFTHVKKSKIWSSLSTAIYFLSPSFRNEAIHLNFIWTL